MFWCLVGPGNDEIDDSKFEMHHKREFMGFRQAGGHLHALCWSYAGRGGFVFKDHSILARLRA